MCSNRMIEKLFNREKNKLLKMNQEVMILDLFVEAPSDEQSYGEKKCEENRSLSFLRMMKHIHIIAEIANQYHEDKHFESGEMKKDCLNSITRISLSEFSLYTQKEALSLNKFSFLIEKIEIIAKKCHENLHLLLGTVPVKIQNKKFVNYAIYVQCGPDPVIDVFAKTCIAKDDIRYDDFNIFNRSKLKDILKSSESVIASLPKNQKRVAISQKPIINARTAGGSEFLILVEICLEHEYRRAKKIFCQELQSLFLGKNHEYMPLQVNHVITSNVTYRVKRSMIGYAITHANATYGKVLSIFPEKGIPAMEPNIDLVKYQDMIKKIYSKVEVGISNNAEITVKNPPFGSDYVITIYSKFSLLEYGLNKYFSNKVNQLNAVVAARRALTWFICNGTKCKNSKHEEELRQLTYHM